MRKRLLTILILLIFGIGITNVHASVNTYDREKLPNYGVNKKWKITDENKDNILNTYAVDASEKIYDYSDVLTEEEEIALKQTIDEFIKKNNTDVVILIDSVSYNSDLKNEEYACDFYDYNDFGMDYNNSGIVIFRNTYSKDPYYNVYAFGDAQLYLSKDRMEATLDHIYQYLHTGNYLKGFTKFIDDLKIYYNQGIPNTMKHYYVDEKGFLHQKYVVPWFEALGISAVVTIVIMYILISKNKMIVKVTKANEYLNKETAKITNKKDTFLSTHTVTHVIDTPSSSGGGGGGFHSSIGSSGGGHSSGGGRHG